jgi:D-alanyl-lipoteichoic acid acyltransferase DltB (MBOAT superfamily)
MFIVNTRRETEKQTNKQKLAYGAYGYSMFPYFDFKKMSLMDRGCSKQFRISVDIYRPVCPKFI